MMQAAGKIILTFWQNCFLKLSIKFKFRPRNFRLKEKKIFYFFAPGSNAFLLGALIQGPCTLWYQLRARLGWQLSGMMDTPAPLLPRFHAWFHFFCQDTGCSPKNIPRH